MIDVKTPNETDSINACAVAAREGAVVSMPACSAQLWLQELVAGISRQAACPRPPERGLAFLAFLAARLTASLFCPAPNALLNVANEA